MDRRVLARSLILVTFVSCVTFASVDAQEYRVSLDHVEGAVGTDSIMAGKVGTFKLRLTNNSELPFVIWNVFQLWSPDGAEWSYPGRYLYVDTHLTECDYPPLHPPCIETTIDSIYTDPDFRRLFSIEFIGIGYFDVDGHDSDLVGWALNAEYLHQGMP